ncbi:hypothetical protein, partial [Phocaeicola vulgatus]|uniref:hypothetical protein n=1 Tax=Phocaeicola vulgatus TaxID=821 RepID=UPI001C388A5C
NSSCSDWLGYTLKRKLTNQENPLTQRSPIDLQKTYPRNKYITPLLFPAFTDRPHSKPVQSPLFYVF